MLMWHGWRWLCVLSVVVAWGMPAAWADPVNGIAVLVDATGVETIDTVTAPPRAGEFRQLGHGFSAGFTRRVHWFRVPLAPPVPGQRHAFLEMQPPYLDDLRLYLPVPGQPGRFIERRAGDLLPFSDREVPAPGFVFRIEFPDGQPLTAYVRLQTSSSSLLTAELWTPSAFFPSLTRKNIVLGLYYGALLAAIASVLWHGLWRTESLHRAYLAYMLGILLLMLGINGWVASYLLPGQTLLAHHWTSVASLFSTAASGYFYEKVLLARSVPWLFYAVRGLIALALLSLLSPLLGIYTEVARLVFPLATLCSALGLLRSIWMWRRGMRGGSLLILAHGSALFGVLVIILTLLGVLPGNFWVLHGSQAGSVMTLSAFAMVMSLRTHRLEDDRRAAYRRAEQARREHEHERATRREQSRFIAMLSHEIKTPLGMIDGAAQVLQTLTPQAPEEVRRRYERIRRGVARLDRLVQQLLHQDRLDDDALTAQCAAVYVPALCEELLSALDGAARIDLQLDASMTVQADRALLGIALSNLVGNALKYSPANSRVELRATGCGPDLVFEVLDRGPGIARELRSTLFDRYVRGQAHGDVSGSGLGLHIVQRVGSLHGGHVAYLERSDGGSIFRLTIPVCRQTVRPTAANAP